MKRTILSLLFLTTTTLNADTFSSSDIRILQNKMYNNLTQNGAVMASPSQSHPDYYYHWVRDAAITMDYIEKHYEINQYPEDKKRLLNYVAWVEKAQNQTPSQPNQDILGEPKFYLNGLPYDGSWGRPQNDGPALRATTLIHFAQFLLQHHQKDYVLDHLYNQNLDPDSMGIIKKDLEYTAHHWQEENFDLWEEVLGHHFFTTMAQRKALIEGAKLARELNDQHAALFYEQQASLMKKRLNQHIDTKNKIIKATLTPHPGPQKTYELDTAVILAILVANQNDDVFAPDNPYIQNTANALYDQFKNLFPINQTHYQAILFGRYPGDTYDGYESQSLGNPWYILTATMSEYFYTLADKLPATTQNRSKIQHYIHQGDELLKLIKQYAPDLSLSEQINRETGIPQGAYDLTWSYIAVLRAIDKKEKLNEKIYTQVSSKH